MNAVVVLGSALEVLRTIPDASVDSVVTDPPAGIAFMGRSWDDPGKYGLTDGADPGVNLALRLRGRATFQAMLRPVFREVLRVLKPGGHALVWALPRTSHWTATAVEDAGFEVRDVGVHLFGTGFPKSLNVSKAIDAAAGVAPTVVGSRILTGTAAMSTEEKGGTYAAGAGARPGATKEVAITEPTTEAAKRWEGFGTALKPAAEHWILARKPLDGTVAANVLEYGTGALNVDGCRIAGDVPKVTQGVNSNGAGYRVATELQESNPSPLGRWPANVTLDEEAAAALDEQSGDRPSTPFRANTATGAVLPLTERTAGGYTDTGGASRFFYVAKPSTREREEGLDHLPRRSAGELVGRDEGSAGMSNPRAGAGRTSKGRANHHPTVKSIALMRWLVRLITPPGGLVLDPFCGSGSTGCAAVLEGMSFIGIDQDPDYVAIATARIAHWGAK